jgi:ATP-binding cassette, subfamily C, bacterial CydC
MKGIQWLARQMLPYWPRIMLALFLSVFSISSHIGLMATSAYLLARAALHPPILDLMATIVGVRFFGLSRAVFRYLERYVSHDVTFRILTQIRVTFYEKIEPLAPAQLSNFNNADLLNRIIGDIETQQNFYLRVFAPPLVAVLVLIGYCVFLASYDLRFSYILAACFLCAGLIIPWVIRRLGQGIGTKIITLKAELNTLVSDSLLGMTELITFGQVHNQLEKIRGTDNKLVYQQHKLTKLSALSSSLIGMIANLGMWLVLVLGILFIEKGALNGVNLGMLALGTLSSFEALYPMALVPQNLEQNITSADRLIELIEVEKSIKSRRMLSPKKDELDLSFQNISFRYEPNEPWALKDLSFEIPQNSKVAIVGPSGVGKTSIVNLLLRFWNYEEGNIFLGGQSLQDYNLEELRNLFGVVTQQTYLFNATIKENLLLANPQGTDEDLILAAQQAKLHEFILSLPNGYDSYIGEGGFKLSGGQRQRLAIARVLLRNAPILILDEAATGLDAQTEQEVMKEVYHLMEGRTTIVITHNLLGLETMDEILVLNQGRIIERGTHQELLRIKGHYYTLWESSTPLN